MHIENIGFGAIQPNTGAAGVIIAGDSATIKNCRGRASIIAAWSRNQVAGFFQVAYPSAHDTTRGWRASSAIGSNLALPLGSVLPVSAQELLSVTIAGSNVGGDLEQVYLTVHYDDVPGMSARLITPAQLSSRVEKLTTTYSSLAVTAGPSYGTPEAINADSDLLRANRDYAVLGATCQLSCGALTLQGPDTSNVRIAVPGMADKPEVCANWFELLSRATGLPCIPVISSGNKTSTLIGVSTDENGAACNVTWHLALLK
jgi:hypothetical protein